MQLRSINVPDDIIVFPWSIKFMFSSLHNSFSSLFTAIAFLRWWSFLAVKFDMDTSHAWFFTDVANSIISLAISSDFFLLVNHLYLCVVLFDLDLFSMSALHSYPCILSLLLGMTLHRPLHFPVAERVHGPRIAILAMLHVSFSEIQMPYTASVFSVLIVLEFISLLLLASLFFKIDSSSNSSLALLVLSVSFLVGNWFVVC